ncbi:hypothetical protein HDU76_005526 [Blyttiomyces sp. JEL0837]|nr:hypothetical protein HDU76_005526 [Blyttiomyces sp. JEL0837]
MSLSNSTCANWHMTASYGTCADTTNNTTLPSRGNIVNFFGAACRSFDWEDTMSDLNLTKGAYGIPIKINCYPNCTVTQIVTGPSTCGNFQENSPLSSCWDTIYNKTLYQVTSPCQYKPQSSSGAVVGGYTGWNKNGVQAAVGALMMVSVVFFALQSWYF